MKELLVLLIIIYISYNTIIMFNIKIYPEVKLIYNSINNLLLIELPWINGSIILINYDRSNEIIQAEKIEEMINLNWSEHNNNDLPFLPFCQTLARPFNCFQYLPSYISEAGSIYKSASITDILELLDAPSNYFDTAKPFIPNNWLWNIDDVFIDSKIQGFDYYDPISVYTAIRRLRNISNNKKFSEILSSRLAESLLSDDDIFFNYVLEILNQSYYVTFNSVKSLSPALNSEFFKSKKLSEYINEENGHHHLVSRSIREIRKKYNLSKRCEFLETKLVINSLSYCATNHPLAFCCLIGDFEKTAQFESDPLADLILKSKLPSAANGIMAHFDINKTGNHSEVGLELALELPPVAIEEVYAALRFSEFHSLALEGISYSVLLNK